MAGSTGSARRQLPPGNMVTVTAINCKGKYHWSHECSGLKSAFTLKLANINELTEGTEPCTLCLGGVKPLVHGVDWFTEAETSGTGSGSGGNTATPRSTGQPPAMITEKTVLHCEQAGMSNLALMMWHNNGNCPGLEGSICKLSLKTGHVAYVPLCCQICFPAGILISESLKYTAPPAGTAEQQAETGRTEAATGDPITDFRSAKTKTVRPGRNVSVDWFKTDAYHESRCIAQLADPWCLKEAASLEASLGIHTETDFEKLLYSRLHGHSLLAPALRNPVRDMTGIAEVRWMALPHVDWMRLYNTGVIDYELLSHNNITLLFSARGALGHVLMRLKEWRDYSTDPTDLEYSDSMLAGDIKLVAVALSWSTMSRLTNTGQISMFNRLWHEYSTALWHPLQLNKTECSMTMALTFAMTGQSLIQLASSCEGLIHHNQLLSDGTEGKYGLPLPLWRTSYLVTGTGPKTESEITEHKRHWLLEGLVKYWRFPFGGN